MRNEKLIEAFGKRVRDLRQEKGLTMEKLAELCDVDYRAIARVENGEVNTSISMAAKVAEGLGVEVSRLFEIEY